MTDRDLPHGASKSKSNREKAAEELCKGCVFAAISQAGTACMCHKCQVCIFLHRVASIKATTSSSADQAANQQAVNKQAVRQPGSQAVRQSGSQAARQVGLRAALTASLGLLQGRVCVLLGLGHPAPAPALKNSGQLA